MHSKRIDRRRWIAGLAAANSLAKAGVHCDVVKWAGAPLGASLALSGRAAEALDELGICQQCYETGTPFTADSKAGAMSDAQGRLISPGAERPTRPGARTAIGVYRPVLTLCIAIQVIAGDSAYTSREKGYFR